ncbi:MAG TPA: glycerol-3-phosphate dehydrogenase, partial [Burkholderiaceae bacterium]|nr:glycerol-3-phosphate dehydrogenase [Burkholderiaceae bacterium]
MNIAVLGAGAWGTAIACALGTLHSVVLQARDSAQVGDMRAAHSNRRYLAGITFPPALSVTDGFDAAVAHA